MSVLTDFRLCCSSALHAQLGGLHGRATVVTLDLAGAFASRAVGQHGGQRLARERCGAAGHLLRRAGRDYVSAGLAPFRSQINDPVSRLDHVQVVLHHQHRVARLHKIVEHGQQQVDVGEMQTGRGFVEQVQRLSRAAFHQLARQFDALRLSSRERRRRLAQLDIVQADVVQGLQLVTHVGNVPEQLQRLLDIHLQHFRNRPVLELDLQRFVVVPMTLADRTGDPHIGQEVHFQPIGSIPLTRFTSTARHVEAEAAGLVAAQLGLRQLGEQVADVVEDFDVRPRIGTRRPPDR